MTKGADSIQRGLLFLFVKIISFIDPYLIPGSVRGDDENKIGTQKYVFTCVKTM